MDLRRVVEREERIRGGYEWKLKSLDRVRRHDSQATRRQLGDEHQTDRAGAQHQRLVDAALFCGQLRDLADARISHVSTLYIPPARDIEFDPEMAARIGWSA